VSSLTNNVAAASLTNNSTPGTIAEYDLMKGLKHALFFAKEVKGVFTFHVNPKYFFFHPSHRIFGCMHGALNVGKKDN
jgi:hypothetical protein